MSYAIHTSVPASPCGMDLYGPANPAPKNVLTSLPRPPYLGEMQPSTQRLTVRPEIRHAAAPKAVMSLAHRIEGNLMRLAAGAIWAHHLADAFLTSDSKAGRQ